MNGIKLNGTYLDLEPGASIQREKNSPFFLANIDGKQGIPGDVSFPFALAGTDNNMQLLGYPALLPTDSTSSFEVSVVDEIGGEEPAKLVMTEGRINLTRGSLIQDCYLLLNSSKFYKLIQDKKLTALSLGGERTFNWTGFIKTGVGFWPHVHDTWNYANCDDGDYVFYPVINPAYLGYATIMNRPFLKAGNILQMHEENVTSLCPHIYVVYIIKQIFAEHGYTVGGDLLEDEDFKKLTLLSLMGVYWSTIKTETRSGEEYLPARPLDTITINLGDHMPPNNTIAEFFVAFQNFLPVGFIVNDLTRHCEIVTTKDTFRNNIVTTVETIGAQVTRRFDDKPAKIYGIKRNFTNDSYAKLDTNLYGTGRGGRTMIVETSSYSPEGATDFIDNTMTPLAIDRGSPPGGGTRTAPNTNWLKTESGTLVANPYYAPIMEVEGNWKDKEEITDWGFRVMFYRGVDFPLDTANILLAPYATHQCKHWRYPGTTFNQLRESFVGNWSLTFENPGYGMIDYWWKEFLASIGRNEILKARIFLSYLEYLDINWATKLQVQNVNYFLQKVNVLMPYPGYIDIEAMRLQV